MSYPRTVKLFKPWAQAMVEGATVDKPNYGKTMRSRKSNQHAGISAKRRRKRRKKKRKNGSKD